MGEHYSLLVEAHIFIYDGCSQENYEPKLPFEGNLNFFISSVVSPFSQVSYNTYAIGNGSSTSSEGTVYSFYQCRGDLQTVDCLNCMESYYLRYDRASFLGMLDTNLKFKKCSESVENDAEFFRRIDDVLAKLQKGVGFKVSSSSMVKGFAQCLGDLSSSDCSSCVGDVVGKLN
ncbi:hypothetical protein V6N13_138125 [Hibiscus sabdariffa]